VHLSCSTAGARPTPQIAWTKGSQVLQGASQTVRIPFFILRFVTSILQAILFLSNRKTNRRQQMGI
jgi:hypothetical protein